MKPRDATFWAWAFAVLAVAAVLVAGLATGLPFPALFAVVVIVPVVVMVVQRKRRHESPLFSARDLVTNEPRPQ